MRQKRRTPQRRSAKKEPAPFRFNVRTGDLPANQRMLHLVRTELKAELRAGFKKVDARFSEMESRFEQIDSRFEQIDSRFEQVDSRFKQVDARFDRLESKIELLHADVARIATLVEEQNSRNQVVLEGLTALWQRQERLEERFEKTDAIVRSIARSR